MQHFFAMKDRRHPRYITYPLSTIIGVTIAALICGAKNWYKIEDYGRKKADWPGRFPDENNGTHSQNAFNLLFALADP